MIYEHDEIPVNKNSIPTREKASHYPHLEEIVPMLTPLQDAQVGILIGYNCPSLLMPKEVCPSPEDNSQAPYAIRTDLGWSLMGGQPMNSNSVITHNCVSYCFRTKVKEIITPAHVVNLMNQDAIRYQSDDLALSVEDKRFLDRLSSRTDRIGKNYQFPLPFKEDFPSLPNNKELAEVRAQQLKRRLSRDAILKKQYTENIDNLLQKGYAERIKEDSADTPGEMGRKWFIPHHGVRQKSKPDKLRVVYDCSASYQGHSLNNILLSGPDLTCNLVGLLCRSRKEEVTVLCDIKEMFYQFQVPKEDRSFLRFLWWPDGDLQHPLATYEMTVHIFGATSSPGCANFGLKRIASDYEETYGRQCANFLRNDFYVDDGVISVPSEEEAIDLLQATKQMCQSAGLHLHKVASNSKRVVESVPIQDRAKNIQERAITDINLPVERALGILYCLETDVFRFEINTSTRLPTRRSILSTTSSIYDPLGFLAPITLCGKQLLQRICSHRSDWDDPVPDSIATQWNQWLSQLVAVKDLKIDRCYKPKDFGIVVQRELHHFSDGSTQGYGQCTYLRQINEKELCLVPYYLQRPELLLSS